MDFVLRQDGSAFPSLWVFYEFRGKILGVGEPGASFEGDTALGMFELQKSNYLSGWVFNGPDTVLGLEIQS